MHTATGQENEMIIDCDRCEVRGTACSDCVVSVLLGGPPEAEPVAEPGAEPVAEPGAETGVELDAEHRRAIEVLADAGMVPRLRALPLTVVDAGDTPGERGPGSRARPGDGRQRRVAG